MQVTLLGAERMEGDNQFFCTKCQKKTDALRQMKLLSMPPYLCVSLQRFVFDMKVGWRLILPHLHRGSLWFFLLQSGACRITAEILRV